MLKKVLPGLAALGARLTAAPEAAAQSVASSSAFRAYGTAQERTILRNFYKKMGMKPPQPRCVSPEAARMRSELMKATSGRAPRPAPRRWPRDAIRRGSSPTSRRPAAPGTRPAVLGAEAMGPTAAEGVRLWTSGGDAEGGITVEENQADRILDAGTCALLHSEDGREKLREGSFNVDATSEVILEAAEAVLADSEDAHHEEDLRKAHDAKEEIKRGEHGPVSDRIKEKVIGIGQTD